jgi:hypothetical protein
MSKSIGASMITFPVSARTTPRVLRYYQMGNFPCYPRFRAAAPGREAATRAAVADGAVLAYWHPKNRITSPSPLMEKPARLGS